MVPPSAAKVRSKVQVVSIVSVVWIVSVETLLSKRVRTIFPNQTVERDSTLNTKVSSDMFLSGSNRSGTFRTADGAVAPGVM